MILPLLTIFQALLIQIALAGPIHRNPDVVRRANAPAKRFIALSKPISFHLIHARATGATGITPVIPGATTTATLTSKGKEDGKVPAVGIGAGNTSLLSLLSSALASGAPTASTTASASASSTASTSPAGSPVEAVDSLASSSAEKEDGKVPAVGVGFGNTSLLSLLSTLTSSTGSSTVAADGAQSTHAAAQDGPQTSPSSMSQTCSNATQISAIPTATSTSPIPASPGSSEQSTTPTTVLTTTVETPSGISSPVQSPPTVSESTTNSPSIPAGSTVTLRISTTMVTTVETTPEPKPTSDAESNPDSPISLASTTVTPLDNPETQNLVTASNSAIPTPTPAVSIETPKASSEVAPSAPAATPTSDSPGMTIPLGDVTIVVNSAPTPTITGNAVIPIMASFITVTVTETVTAR